MPVRELNRRQLIQRMMVSGVLSTVGFMGCEPKSPRSGHTLHGRTMGTTFTIRLPRLPRGLDIALLRDEVVGILDAVDRRMSTFRPDSELSRFNRSSDGRWHSVSVDTAAVVTAALATSDLTRGAFDVTSGPLVELWGFGPAARRTAPPGNAEVASVRADTGIAGLDVRRSQPALHKSRPGLRIDLSGIAKGFAVDRIAAMLTERGLADFLIEVGGEIRVRGRNARGRPWAIGVERPGPGGNPLHGVIDLFDGAVATSGDYRSWYFMDGRPYSHIIDPREGRPVNHDLTSVTVIAEDAMRSDALATGLMVLGPDEGREAVLRAGIAALLISRRDQRLEEWASPAFKNIIEG